jgi:hypothetical protein
MAKPRPQLKAVLQRLVVVVVVGGVLHDDGVIAFADFSPLLGCGSETNIFKSSCKTQDISTSTRSKDYSTRGVRLLTSFGGRVAEYS